MTHRPEIQTWKQKLGINRFVLQVHDASFPSRADEDWGRGSPYTGGAEDFFGFAHELGFDTIQLGPQGSTGRGNPSPYDATCFSRNPLNLPLDRFARQGRLDAAVFQSLLVSPTAPPKPHATLHDEFQGVIAGLVASADTRDRAAADEFLEANQSWLVPDALFEVLCELHGTGRVSDWGATAQGRQDQCLFAPPLGEELAASRRLESLRRECATRIRRFALIQWLLDSEHRALRKRLATLSLELFGDLQIGMAPQDVWAHPAAFLTDYRMGAPPSRTNPEGQPWGYAVLDPHGFGTHEHVGPALEFLAARVAKTLAECDGLRIDHPHGWVDPWVYRHDTPDALHAVQHGARLFSSPDEADHPLLRQFAIARADQIDATQARYAEHRVIDLNDSQVARYSKSLDALVEIVRQRRPNAAAAIACEVLSTLPYPLQRVLERHKLGRFRVVQKADLRDPGDVYRIERAESHDWIMLSTHDTPGIWSLMDRWALDGRAAEWAQYLAGVFPQSGSAWGLLEVERPAPSDLVHGLFAAILASRARQVAVFFPDLLGIKQRYNEPGVVSDANWRLRVPTNFEAVYADGCRHGTVLDLRRCIQWACDVRTVSSDMTMSSRTQGEQPTEVRP